mmetsp:Transcript_74919/g.206634  ORF Transcript_74919/g.206634 Transcript_74919/m.206634 type:complete len:222 (-) Transcript_74919:83-748(-)
MRWIAPKRRKSSRRSESLTSSDRLDARTVQLSSRCAASSVLREPSALRIEGGTYDDLPPWPAASCASELPPPSPSPRPPPPKSSRGARPCCLAHSAASDAPPSRCLGRQASKDVTFIFSKARCADSLFSSAARAFGVMSSVCSLASRLVMPASVKPLPWYPAGLPASSPNLAHLRRASTDLRILIACFATLTVRTVLILKPNSLVLYVVIVLMPFMSGSDS